MPKKAPTKKPARPLSDKTRADDERLRESLRNADMKALDRALAKAILPPKAPHGR